ncbi:MAG: M20 family metallopeptidase [Anaerohalosphaeraceae bacterium]|nr:M20 family metallopeptidase [Anaerohalosphaeraceae bacterium]
MTELLKKLINAKSTAEDGEFDAAVVLGDYFKNCGLSAEIDCWQDNRANLILRTGPKTKAGPLVFLCHLDVVPPGKEPWTSEPFEATERDGKIYGRGAVDMKGPIAACATAIAEIVNSNTTLKGEIIFAAVAAEETDSCGVSRFMQKYEKSITTPAKIIVTEPTDFALVTAHKSLLWLEVITMGKTAHGSMPALGVNAIEFMVEFIEKVSSYNVSKKTDELLGQGSLSVNKISGGTATNIVPEFCRTEIDIRTLPENNNEEILRDLENIFETIKKTNSKFKAEMKILRNCPGLQTDQQSDFIKRLQKILGIDKCTAVSFTTDAPHVAGLGPVAVFGPGKPDMCHKPDEHISIADLKTAVDCYKKIILEFPG